MRINFKSFICTILFLVFSVPFVSASCGNSVCDTGENACSCPQDCGKCSGEVKGETCKEYFCTDKQVCSIKKILNCCGNDFCEESESYGNCPADCQPRNINIEVISPPEGEKIRYGESILYKVKADADGRSIAGSEIIVDGPFADKFTLFNDGQHDDEKFSDGIYAAVAKIETGSPAGISDVNFVTRFREIDGNASVKIVVFPFLDLNLTVPSEIELGNSIILSGIISVKAKASPSTVFISVSDDKGYLIETDQIESGVDGKFDFQYRTSFIHKPGKWGIRLQGEDFFGNTFDANKIVSVYEPGKIPQREITLLKSLKPTYIAGEEIDIALKVTENTQPLSSGKVVAAADGFEAALTKIAEGEYAGVIKLPSKSGNARSEIVVSVFSEGANIIAKKEFAFDIVAATLNVEIVEPQKKLFEIGEEVEIIVAVNYSDSAPSTDAEVFAVLNNDKRVKLEPISRGIFAGKYKPVESDYGQIQITIVAKTPQGSEGKGEEKIFVKGEGITNQVEKNSPVIFTIVAVAAIIVVFLWQKVKNRVSKKIKSSELKRIDDLEKSAQKKYFQDKNIDADEYKRRMENYKKAKRELK